MQFLIHAIKSDGFTAFVTLWGLIGDAAVLALTIYTLHITAFSRKLKLISPSFGHSIFYGTRIALTVMNKSLHAIPAQKVFVMKLYEGRFYHIELAKFSDPVSIDSWSIKKIEMEPFTAIEDWPVKNYDGYPDYDSMITPDAVIGIISGKDIIWIKPYKKAPLRDAKKAYKNHTYQRVSVYRHEMDGRVVSPAVDCHVTVKVKDINGQNVLLTALGISTFNGGEDLYLNNAILGFNVFDDAGHTEKSIRKALAGTLGIDKENIYVEMVDNGLGL